MGSAGASAAVVVSLLIVSMLVEIAFSIASMDW
jgi:hypothetical protein